MPPSNLGEAALLQQGAYERTAERLHQRVLLAGESGDKHHILALRGDLAKLEPARSGPERAVRLAGAEAGLRDALHIPVTAAERDSRTSTLETVRAQLGEDCFQRAWDDWCSMTLDEAAAHALEETGQAPRQ